MNYPGREHWALLLPEVPGTDPEDVAEGIVLDPTARQFGAALPHPYAADLLTWLDDMAAGMCDELAVQVFAGDPDSWTSTSTPSPTGACKSATTSSPARCTALALRARQPPRRRHDGPWSRR